MVLKLPRGHEDSEYVLSFEKMINDFDLPISDENPYSEKLVQIQVMKIGNDDIGSIHLYLIAWQKFLRTNLIC